MSAQERDLDEADDEHASTLHAPDEEDEDPHAGDYSARMDDLFSGFDDVASEANDEEEDADSDFVYTGEDAAETSAAYRDRLRDALGSDHDPEEETEIERSSIIPPHLEDDGDDEPLVSLVHSRP